MSEILQIDVFRKLEEEIKYEMLYKKRPKFEKKKKKKKKKKEEEEEELLLFFFSEIIVLSSCLTIKGCKFM